MYFMLFSFLVLGAGIKYIDEAFDEKTFSKKIAMIIAPCLGLLWAYTMLVNEIAATILLAVLVAVLLKGKIDNYAHVIGLLIILGIIIIAGVNLLIIPLLVLAVSALLDEVGNDFVDKSPRLQGNRRWQKSIVCFFDQRWLTKIAILGLVIINMLPWYAFLAMVLFDSAYLMVRWYGHAQGKIHKTPEPQPQTVSCA